MRTLLFLLLCINLQASETTVNAYFDLLKQYPHLITPQGTSSKGEIEIITDPLKITQIEKATSRAVGIIAQDKYWIWINDACRFPSGHEGLYSRILWLKALDASTYLRPGIAVMPILPNGKIVLNCNFRHATRSWEIELPRGGLNAGETFEEAAKRETMEETGMLIDDLGLLGEIPPDSGLTGTLVPIYFAEVIKKEETKQEETEAIENILSLSIPEIKQAFLKGSYTCQIRGETKQVHFRDPFLAYALLLYEMKK